MTLRLISLLLALAFITSCATTSGTGSEDSDTASSTDNEKKIPELSKFYDGVKEGWGVIQDNQGKILHRFFAIMETEWHNGIAEIHETYRYSNSQESSRTWQIEKKNDQYIITGDDIIGQGSGQIIGNRVAWKYDRRIVSKNAVDSAHFVDSMVIINAESMVLRGTIRQAGNIVGGIVVSYHEPVDRKDVPRPTSVSPR